MRRRVFQFSRQVLATYRWLRLGDGDAAGFSIWIGWTWLIHGHGPTTQQYIARSQRRGEQ